MIPSSDVTLPEAVEFVTEPSKNYRMNTKERTVNGYVDELSAMEQVVFKILNTERYDNIIYSWDYGIELKDLYGQDFAYVIPEAESRITEALMQDDRITGVENFEYHITEKNQLLFTFTVHTIFGDVETEKGLQA